MSRDNVGKDVGFPGATEIRAGSKRRRRIPLTPAERQALHRERDRDVESVLGLVMDLLEGIEGSVPESQAYEWILTNVVAALGERRLEIMQRLEAMEFPATDIEKAIVREIRRQAVGKAQWASRVGVIKRFKGFAPAAVVGRWIVRLEREGLLQRSSDGKRVRVVPESAGIAETREVFE